MSKFTEDDFLALYEYANLEGAEVGQLNYRLLDLWESYRPYMSDKLTARVERELIGNLKWFRENTKIVSRQETIKQEWRELEFLDE